MLRMTSSYSFAASRPWLIDLVFSIRIGVVVEDPAPEDVPVAETSPAFSKVLKRFAIFADPTGVEVAGAPMMAPRGGVRSGNEFGGTCGSPG